MACILRTLVSEVLVRDALIGLVFALSLLACDGASVADGGPPGGDAGPAFDGAMADVDAGDAGRPPLPDAGPGDGVVREGRICTPGGWCWETPTPGGGAAMTGLWAPAPGRLVGADGLHMFHVEGDTLRWAAPPTLRPYGNASAVWGASADDVWSSAFTTLIRFDGGRWTTADTLGGVSFSSALSGVDARDVWSVGFGTAHHYDGTWTEVPLGAAEGASLVDVWAFGARDAIVVGSRASSAFAARVQGTTLTDLGLTGMFPATSVYASGPDDVWVLAGGSLRHFDGSAWSEVTSVVALALSTAALWGSGPDDVWLATRDGALRVTSEGVETYPLETAGAIAIAGTGPDDVWASDLHGQLHHFDGTTWTRRFKATLAAVDLVSIAPADDGTAWAVGATAILRRAPDGTWTASESPTTSPLTGVARAGDETFLFASGGSYRRDGDGWSVVLGGASMTDACRTDDGVIWGVGGGGIRRYEGGEWVVDAGVATSAPLGWIACRGDEAWAAVGGTTRAGDGLVRARYDGDRWAVEGLTSIARMARRATHATSRDDVWVAAGGEEEPAITMRWDGGAWRSVPGAPETVRGIGGSAGDVWLVGDAGTARRWDGSGFADVDVPAAPDLRWVHAGGDGTATALTEAGEVWSYAAGAWARVGDSLEEAGYPSRRLVDAAHVGGAWFAVHDTYVALRFDGATWTPLAGGFVAAQVEGNDETGVWLSDISYQVGRWDGATVVPVDEDFREARRLVVPVTGDAVFALGFREVYRHAAGSFVSDHPVEASGAGAFGYDAEALWLLEPPESSRDRHTVWRRGESGWTSTQELARPIGVGEDAEGRLLLVDQDLAMWRRETTGELRRVIAPEGLEGRGHLAHVYDLDDAWALGAGGLFHFDGAAWTTLGEPVGFIFRDLGASPSGALYAVGAGAAVVRREAP